MNNNSEVLSKQKKRISKYRIILIIVVSLLIVLTIGVFVYLGEYYHSRYTLEQYQQEYEVSITESNSVISLKSDVNNDIGIIFYPGGKVEYTAYIPLLEPLAELGYTCFIPKMPGNLAVFGIKKADKVIDNNPDIETWYMAGHSLGGAMASSYVGQKNGSIKGIILLGAYPSTDLSSTNLKMLSIVGSNDKVMNKEKYETAKSNAPKRVFYKMIVGGNHAGYGDYGEQEGDGKSTISGKEQINQTAEWIDEFCNLE